MSRQVTFVKHNKCLDMKQTECIKFYKYTVYIAVQLVILWDDTIYHLFLSLACYKSTGETKLTEKSKNYIGSNDSP